jgi:hypothetical protein
MSAKHTPGPWEIGDENNQHIEICIGDAVANLDRQDRYGLHMCFSREEMRANGHLIAAAPKLLKALEKAVSRQGFSNDDLISARAIIAKAKGES